MYVNNSIHIEVLVKEMEKIASYMCFIFYSTHTQLGIVKVRLTHPGTMRH